MLTELGIFLRKLRLDKNEIMKDMALKFGVSSAFLSAVENGKKKMPSNWIEEIPAIYKMKNEELNEFRKSVANSEDAVEINLQNLSPTKRQFAFSLARKLDTIDEEDVLRMIKKLKGDED